MLEDVWRQIEDLLSLNSDQVGAAEMVLRAVIVYTVTLVVVRAGNKRFLGKSTAFDVILGIILGSIMSRAVTGSSPFLPTLLAGAAFVGLHWLLSFLAFKTDWFGTLVKGQPVELIRDGVVQEDGMRRSALSEKDLAEAQRLDGREPDVAAIKGAHLERSGDISLIPRRREPRILEVTVESGVQTVRIELT